MHEHGFRLMDQCSAKRTKSGGAFLRATAPQGTISREAMQAWQKMLRAFFPLLGKSCHVFLPMILAKDVASISRQEFTLLSTLYLLSLTIGNAS
jgi:hypothetical protein